MIKPIVNDIRMSVRVESGEGRERAKLVIGSKGARKGVDHLRLELHHALGVTTGYYPADQQEVGIDLSTLPSGPAVVRLMPVLSSGREGVVAEAAFSVPGKSGNRSIVIGFRAIDQVLRSPASGSFVVPRFELALKSGGKDGGTLFFRLRFPDGVCADTHLPLTHQNPCRLRPYALAAGSPAGRYELTVTLVNREGDTAEPLCSHFEVSDKGVCAPAIEVASWRAEERIVLRGSGFDAPGLIARIDGTSVPIAEVNAQQMVLVARNTLPAQVAVATDHGFAFAANRVGPPPSMRILPEDPVVEEGTAVQLHALVRGIVNARVLWSAGSSSDVAISETGLLRVGPAAPDQVLVRARVQGSRVSASIRVTVHAPQGEHLIVGRRGGVVKGRGGAVLTLAVGALDGPRSVQLECITSTRFGHGPLVAAELTCKPAKLAHEAHLRIPLSAWVDPGQLLAVEQRIDGVWRDAGRAEVDPSGFEVNLKLKVLPERLRVVLPWLRDRLMRARPAITSIRDTPIEEGDTVALLVTGANFVPGLTAVSVLRGGQVDQRVECRGVAVRQDGSALGVTVAVSPLPELGEGVLSDHLLRVQTPAGAADFALPILGHNELIVAAGESVSVDRPQRLSALRIDTGGTLRVAFTVPPVTIDVLGDAIVDGTILVEAAPGVNGARGVDGGQGGSGGQAAQSFGVGRGGNGGGGGPNGASDGGAGTAGTGASVVASRPGAAGLGGTAGGGGIFPHMGDFGSAGMAAADPHIPAAGRSGIYPSISAGAGIGAGGGGGGGGGGEGWVFVNSGGGGGGGGAGGGGFGLAAGSSIRLRGIVLALGGDGGSGGTAGSAPPAVWTLISAGGGAGGGGGSGGTILLQGIDMSSGATVLATTGRHGATVVDDAVRVEPRSFIEQAAAQDASGDIRADGAIVGLVKPIATQGPDLLYLRQLVTTRNWIDINAFNATHMRVSNAFTSNQMVQVTQLGNAGLNADTFFVRGSVPLEVGFNTVVAEQETLPGVPAMTMQSAAVRKRRILYIDQTIAHYAFTAHITAASLVVATERGTRLAVRVTATQSTPLIWTVRGGLVNGAVRAHPGGALYTAPSRPVDTPVTISVNSAFSPNLGDQVELNVIPGVVTSATAANGTPALASLPSANCGQVVTLEVNPSALALTQQAFSQVQAVEFERLMSQGGNCVHDVLPVQPTINTGLLSLTAEVPACADPLGWVRVPGHGSLRLQIVPVITGLIGNRASSPDYTIIGSGFACNSTQVLVDGTLQTPSSISCGALSMSPWPNHGASLVIRTSGGESAPFTVP